MWNSLKTLPTSISTYSLMSVTMVSPLHDVFHCIAFVSLLGPAGGCCSIQELLEFFTGSGYPPQGFSRKCTISFLHDTTARLPTAATCNLELRLPTCHGEDYSQFRECMMLAIRGCEGFGPGWSDSLVYVVFTSSIIQTLYQHHSNIVSASFKHCISMSLWFYYSFVSACQLVITLFICISIHYV